MHILRLNSRKGGPKNANAALLGIKNNFDAKRLLQISFRENIEQKSYQYEKSNKSNKMLVGTTVPFNLKLWLEVTHPSVRIRCVS